MSDPTLFDAAGYEVPAAPELTPGQRLRVRQADKMAAGEHPLSRVGDVPKRVLLLTPANEAKWCGTCAHKLRPHHHGRAYPKCAAGAFRSPDGNGFRDVWLCAAHSESTDVRSWWPACSSYESREETR